MVLVSEEREIPRTTVPGLLEAFQGAFSSPFKVERLVYERGRGAFTVERLLPEDAVAAEDDRGEGDYLTAYQVIRQHAELDVQEPIAEPLEAIARAVQSLTARGFDLTMFVCESRELVRDWLKRDLRPEDIWQVPLVEDADATGSGVFVVGSKSGTLVRDIEAAILCRLGS
jgi:hypothetical protein